MNGNYTGPDFLESKSLCSNSVTSSGIFYWSSLSGTISYSCTGPANGNDISYYFFGPMRVGPGLKADNVAPHLWLFYPAEEKDIYSMMQWYNDNIIVWSPLKCNWKKSLTWGWWPSLHDTNFTPVWFYVGNQLPRFQQATGSSSSPSLSPFQPHKPMHVI